MEDSEVTILNGLDRKNSGKLRQITTSLIISLGPLNSGMIAGWISPMSLKLMQKDSPIGFVSKEELSILAALPNYFVLLFAPLFTFIINRYGRRFGLRLAGLLSCMSAVIITFSSSETCLRLGRLSTGFAAFASLIAPMYIAEIVNDTFRGVLTSFCTIQFNLGVLISYAIGNLLSYKEYNCIMIVVPSLFTLLSFWFPESPYFLNDQSRKEDALKSLLWYRAQNKTLAENEFKSMESSNVGRTTERTINIFKTLESRSTRRALMISISLFAFQTLSGIQIVLNYDELIYEELSSPVSLKYSPIILATLILFGSCVGMSLVDVIGRKPLLYISFILGSICMTVLSLSLLATRTGNNIDDHGWIAFSCLNVFVLVYGLGLGFVPGLITTEVTHSRSRAAISSITLVFLLILVIIVLQSFPFIDESIGLFYVFLIPAVTNLCGAIFTWLVVPETNGKSLAQIIDELNRE